MTDLGLWGELEKTKSFQKCKCEGKFVATF